MIKAFLLATSLLAFQAIAADKSLSEFEFKINSLREEQVQLQIEKSSLQMKIDELDGKLGSLKLLLLKRAKSTYRMQTSPWGEILMNSNLAQLNTQLRVIKNMNQNDLNVYRDYSVTMKLLKDSKQNLSETEKAMQSNVKFYEEQQTAFEKREQIEIGILKQTGVAGFLLKKGSLTRPLESPIRHEFGQLRDQEGQYYLLNQGQIYSGARSTTVKAIGPGVVIFRDELQRWRETLIVQHDDNYYSIYAGITHPKKTVGEAVKMNESLATTASTEFYFELRHFSYPINPKKWYEVKK